MLPARAALVTMVVLASAGAACAPRSDGGADTSTGSLASGDSARPAADPCNPVETRPPTAASQNQAPARPGQTRTCAIKSNTAFDVTIVAKGLVNPWSVEPLPGGDLLVTEKPGRLRIISATGTIGEPIAGLPRVDARGQGGLLDVALSPAFDSDRTIFWTFAEPRQGGNGTSIARGVLSADRRRLEQVRVIFRVLPIYDGDKHFGSRLAFGPDGLLYAGFGERSDTPMRPYAQRLDSHLGKIVRIKPEDGSAPADNPLVGQANALPEIWSVGHRNIQAMAFDGDGRLWDIEHGTNGGDELNLVEKGKNYGWPVQAYGIEYAGGPIPGASTNPPGFEQPAYYWDPVIAPSGAQWYSGDAFPEWRGNLFVGSLKEKRLVRLVVNDRRVIGEEHLLTDRGQRVRDVRQGPDGALYLVTDEKNGELWRVAPRR